MTDNEFQIFLANQERMADEQRKMANDIGEIKVAVKEGAQLLGFLSKNYEGLAARVEKTERSHAECPARLRAHGYGMMFRDFALLLAIIGGIVGAWKAMG
jgi:hypothetical protein